MTKRCWAAKRASFGWNSIGRETKDRSIPPDSASGILRSRPDFSSFLPPCTRAACCARHVNAFFGVVVVVVVLVGGKLTHRVLAPLRFFLPSVRSCSRFRVSYEGNLISLRLSLSLVENISDTTKIFPADLNEFFGREVINFFFSIIAKCFERENAPVYGWLII